MQPRARFFFFFLFNFYFVLEYATLHRANRPVFFVVIFFFLSFFPFFFEFFFPPIFYSIPDIKSCRAFFTHTFSMYRKTQQKRLGSCDAHIHNMGNLPRRYCL